MIKLIIQIPCYNEEEILPITLKALPRQIPGIHKVEWLVINDGSTDKTVEVAKLNGVDHVVNFSKRHGLAKGFMAGLDACLKLGADVIVNTDGDNQYNADDISKLITPILEKKADIVVGARPINDIDQFSPLKKGLQRMGSWVVRIVSKTNIPDATSGFRAMSRDGAIRLNVFNEYTYTLETIIQAGQKHISIMSVPIRINKWSRPSRLIKSTFSYVQKSIVNIIRIFVVYKPFRFFMSIGLILFLAGFSIGIRFLYFYFTGGGSGHIQSLIFSAILLGIGFQTILVAFLADLQSVNRRLMEDIQYRLKKLFYAHEVINKDKQELDK
jgi:glycosyltransferase involved in cell wall biosynthesis